MSDYEINVLIMGIEQLAERQDQTELDRRVGDFAKTTRHKAPQARQAIAQRLRPEFQPDCLELGELGNAGLRRAMDILTAALAQERRWPRSSSAK